MAQGLFDSRKLGGIYQGPARLDRLLHGDRVGTPTADGRYLDLLKSNPEVPAFCIDRVKKEFVKYADADLDSTNLPKTMMGIAAMEMKSVNETGDEGTQTSAKVTDTVTTENVLVHVIPNTLTVPLRLSEE
jgi:hypothetical protein